MGCASLFVARSDVSRLGRWFGIVTVT